MGSFSLWHWVIVIAYLAVVIVPFWKIFGRIGYPKALSLLAAIPVVSIVMLWIVAVSRWPRVERENAGDVFR